jgi:hypothetical protein
MFNKTILSKMYVLFYVSTLVLPQSVADLNIKYAISRERFICGPMLTETFLLIVVCSFYP